MRRKNGYHNEYLFGDDFFGEETRELGPDDSDEAVQGSGQTAARLADGSGFLITDGPGAGSVTDHSSAPKISEAPPLPERDDALDGTLPLVIVHRPYRYSKTVPRLLAQLHAAAGRNLALGVSSRLSGASVKSHTDFNSSCSAAAIRIVDPVSFISDPQDIRVGKLADQAVKWAPYLGGAAVPTADLLDMQRERGANLLLTSGRALDPSNASGSLGKACKEGDDALAELKPGERLALNVTVSVAWLKSERLLDDLLTELIEREQFDTWHVRVQWPSPAWTQPTDKELLAGYRKLAQRADEEERQLLLPQTGLTGWLTLAWGAAGFGTGTSGSDQAFLEPRGANGNNPQIERYFERQLLHTVERTARPLLIRDPAYVQCQCPYCRPLLAEPAWSFKYAGLHYLFSVGLLTSQVAQAAIKRSGPHGAVSRAVQSASRFAAGKALIGSSDPVHLRTWDQLL